MTALTQATRVGEQDTAQFFGHDILQKNVDISLIKILCSFEGIKKGVKLSKREIGSREKLQ